MSSTFESFYMWEFLRAINTPSENRKDLSHKCGSWNEQANVASQYTSPLILLILGLERETIVAADARRAAALRLV